MRPAAVSGGLALLLAACTSNPPLEPVVPPRGPSLPAPAQVPIPPIAPELVPDATPRAEARSRYGNPPFYDVFGRRYYVLPSSVGYVERGVASWYGPGFHEERTSTGEPYDMFGMTAAHKTLPLPAYVRVTNLENGRSIVVRVNDRGPFVGNRIIDLSYTAAAKLDMLRNGTALVEVRAIDPAAPGSLTFAATADAAAATLTAPPAPAAQPAPVAQPAGHDGADGAGNLTLFIQAGAFADPANAERLAAKLRGGGYGTVFVRENRLAGRTLYRVRIGPVPDVAEFDRVVAALESVGVSDARLALD
jgi:rare lipoprotein A